MIRKLTLMACCFAAAFAVSFTTASQADAQVFSQRGYRAGHYVGNTARAFTNTTRNVVNRTNRFWNGNRYSYNNNYSYQNFQNQDQSQTPTTDMSNQTGNVPVNSNQSNTFPYKNSTGSTQMTPARSYTPIPTPAIDPMPSYKK